MMDLGSIRTLACSLALAVVAAGCSDDRTSPVAPGDSDVASVGSTASVVAGDQYVVLGKGNKLPKGFEADIAAAGGEIVRSVPQIGAALVRASDPGFVGKVGSIRGVSSVSADITVQMVPTTRVVKLTSDIQAELDDPPLADVDDPFFNIQWWMDAIDWPEAVEISDVRGQGARVAILDSGIDASHPDLIPNLNVGLSTSFVGGEAFDNPPGDHGTHVSGIVGAAWNDFGVIGTAPEAELVSVKVLSETTGEGSFLSLAVALVYASEIDADVVNMSIGSTLDRDGTLYDADCNVAGQATARDVAETVNLIKRATQYAHQNGVTLIASSGNCGGNGDKDKNRIHLPSDVPHVLSIAATGPVGWALDSDTNLDRLASYSNFGRSVIDFAAPGGDFVLPGNDVCGVVVGQLCWVFDMVFSTVVGGWGWMAGTSMAAPAATGIAALIISKNGGDMKPAQVEAAMRKAVNFDDGGAVASSGRTAEFGRGQLSALEALK